MHVERRRSRDWGRRCSRAPGRPAPVLLVALAVAVASPARADFSGRAVVGYQSLDSDDLDTQGLTQTYDLNVARSVSPMIRYRLGLHVQDDLGTATLGGVRHGRESRLLRPAVELLYSNPAGGHPVQVQINYDLSSATTMTSRMPDVDQQSQRIGGRTAFAFSPELSLFVEASRRDDESEASRVDVADSSARAGVSYLGGPLSVQPMVHYGIYRDAVQGFSRRALSVVAPLGLEQSWGNVGVSAQNSVNWSTVDERTEGGQAARVPTRHMPLQGLAVVDDSPLDSRDRPLTALPALIDDDPATGVGVSVGPSGTPFQALGVDMGRFLELDEVVVYVRTPSSDPAPSGGGVTFSAYASPDGVLWTDLAASTTFNAGQSRYEVSFPTATARFFKVVSFGLNELETLVTELEVFSHAELTAGEERRTQTLLEQLNLGLTARLGERWTLSSNTLANVSRQEPEGRPAFVSFDLAEGLSVAVDVTREINAEARYDLRRVFQSGGRGDDLDSYTGRLRYTPLPTLTSGLQGSYATQEQAGTTSAITSVGSQTWARLMPALDVAVDVGGSRQSFDIPAPQEIDRFYASSLARAEVVRSLHMQAVASVQRSASSGPLPGAVGSAGSSRDDRFTIEAFYRPSQQLNVAARLGWASGYRLSGPIQRYRVDWYPFPGGALLFAVSYDRDIQPYAGQQMQRLSIAPRWTVNRHAWLDASYTLTEVESPLSLSRISIFVVTLTLNT